MCFSLMIYHVQSLYNELEDRPTGYGGYYQRHLKQRFVEQSEQHGAEHSTTVDHILRQHYRQPQSSSADVIKQVT